jgi:hypothetical protein
MARICSSILGSGAYFGTSTSHEGIRWSSIQVLREVGRVLKVGGPTVITFSNRCFPSKAVVVWHQLDNRGRMRLVERYLRETGNWSEIYGLDRSPRRLFSDPLYAVVGRSTGPCVRDT